MGISLKIELAEPVHADIHELTDSTSLMAGGSDNKESACNVGLQSQM